MLSGKALDPRLAEDKQRRRGCKALVKECLVSSKDSTSFVLDDPDSPILRPIDSKDDHLYNTELPPLNLDDSCSDTEDNLNRQIKSSCSLPLTVGSTTKPIPTRRTNQSDPSRPRKARLIRDFIESQLQLSETPETIFVHENTTEGAWLL